MYYFILHECSVWSTAVLQLWDIILVFKRPFLHVKKNEYCYRYRCTYTTGTTFWYNIIKNQKSKINVIWGNLFFLFWGLLWVHVPLYIHNTCLPAPPGYIFIIYVCALCVYCWAVCVYHVHVACTIVTVTTTSRLLVQLY